MSAEIDIVDIRTEPEHLAKATEPIEGGAQKAIEPSSNSAPLSELNDCNKTCIKSTDGATDYSRPGKRSDQTGPSSAKRRLQASQRGSVQFAPADSLEEHYEEDTAGTQGQRAERRPSTPLIFNDPFEPDLAFSRKSSSSTDVDEYLRPGAFAGHRDTLARIQMLSRRSSISSTSTCGTTIHRRPTKNFSDASQNERGGRCLLQNVFELISAYLGPEDSKSLLLICKPTTTSASQPVLSAVQRMPGELLQMIYSKLSPSDFDAIRHTCSHLFLASLDKRLLLLMIQRSGALCALQHDLRRREETTRRKVHTSLDRHVIDHIGHAVNNCHTPEVDDIVSDEWLYSKRLATEARLSPAWKGVHHDLAMAEGF